MSKIIGICLYEKKKYFKITVTFLLAVNNLFTYSRKQSYRCLNTQATEPILIKKVTKFSNKKNFLQKDIGTLFQTKRIHTLNVFSKINLKKKIVTIFLIKIKTLKTNLTIT